MLKTNAGIYMDPPQKHSNNVLLFLMSKYFPSILMLSMNLLPSTLMLSMN